MWRRIVLFLAAAAFLLPAAGCASRTPREASGTGMYFDTVVDIRIVDRRADVLLQECFDLCRDAELVLSAHDEDSELYRLNHRTEQEAEVSQELAGCIAQGLAYGELTDGAFDITVLPLRELWDFESEDPKVPNEEDIQAALKHVDYRAVSVDGTTVSFSDPETQIDLGGIAKGYISARLKGFLEEEGCTCALINLGGNVSALGTKPDGSRWVVGIQEPFADRGTVLETVEIDHGCVISSGTYERCFEENGRLYHHILDLTTGCPAETDLQQATVIGEDDVFCDAFSTTCILLGREKAEQLAAESGKEIRILFVDGEGNRNWYGGEP